MTPTLFTSPRRRRGRLLAAVATMAVTAGLLTPMSAAAATLQDDLDITVADGYTQPVFDYPGAIRERVFIPVAGVDQDLDGVDDVTAIDIIRPAGASATAKFPAIIDPSPYYTTSGRGNESQRLTDVDGDGVADLFPLFYDNYFVPRGYAVIHAQMNGTAWSTGCPMHGGPGDIQSMKVVVDWLNGRVAGYNAAGDPVTAGWHSGKSAMIGKSYDGTLANGVAATGVDGLTTIVPIAAISQWYRYSRTNGIRHNTDYASGLANTVTNPARRTLCAPTRTTMNAVDGDETGDINQFWADRDYLKGIDNVKASVFLIHGLNDDNVRMSQIGEYWDLLAERNIPRKIWLPRLGHIDPFDFNRAEWVDTLHRWFDYWLQNVPNGIMSEPQSTVEFGPSEYVHEASWPAPTTEFVEVNLTGTAGAGNGKLRLQPTEDATTLSFTGGSTATAENTLIQNPQNNLASRVVLLSDPLEADLRISGTPEIKLDASLSQEQSNLSAILVDYSTATRTPRSPGDGVINLTTRTCWGAQSEHDIPCYLEVERRSASSAFWRVSRGVLDSSNRESFIDGEATVVVPGQQYDFDYKMEPYDYVFKAGSQIGVVLSTNLSGFVAGSANATVTFDATTSTISLPIVGGVEAAVAAGGLGKPVPSFSDLSETAAFHDEIIWAANNGIANGYADGSFRPASPVSRDAFAAFLYRLAAPADFVAPAVSPFADVKTSHPFYTEIAWLASTGISTGYVSGGKTTFRPSEPVSRSATAAFLARFADQFLDVDFEGFVAPETSPFTDVATGNTFYKEISWLASTGISTGSVSGAGVLFKPANTVDRQAAAAFLYRLAHL